MILRGFTECVHGFPSRSPKTVNIDLLSMTEYKWSELEGGGKFEELTKRYLERYMKLYEQESTECKTNLIVSIRTYHSKLHQLGFKPYPAGL